jgi:spore coat polysaccharide biosynthesis protein SpsF
LKKKIIAIIQARMGSKRLPGKCMMRIVGKPLLHYQINQVQKVRLVDSIVVATTNGRKDDVINNFCERKKIYCFRGSEKNVLKRYFDAATFFKADIVIRLTSDCPLIDPKIIKKTIEKFLSNKYDYVSTTCPVRGATYADGMDVEIFSYLNLFKAYKLCKSKIEKEHVTYFFWMRPKQFRLFRLDLNKSYRNYRLTVDYIQDFMLVKKILLFFLRKNIKINFKNIISFLKQNPKYLKINLSRNKEIM